MSAEPGVLIEGLEERRVAHTSSFMYAPHEHAQHPRQCVLSVACPAFLTVPQGGMSAPHPRWTAYVNGMPFCTG